MRDPGGVATFAFFALGNPTDQPIVIDKVALVPSPQGAQVRAVRTWIAHKPKGKAWFAAVSGPPDAVYSMRHPAKGTMIPAHSPKDYVVGLTLRSLTKRFDTLTRADGVTIRYHIGGDEYLDYWPDQVVLCPRSCRPWDTPNDAKWPPRPVSPTES